MENRAMLLAQQISLARSKSRAHPSQPLQPEGWQVTPESHRLIREATDEINIILLKTHELGMDFYQEFLEETRV